MNQLYLLYLWQRTCVLKGIIHRTRCIQHHITHVKYSSNRSSGSKNCDNDKVSQDSQSKDDVKCPVPSTIRPRFRRMILSPESRISAMLEDKKSIKHTDDGHTTINNKTSEDCSDPHLDTDNKRSIKESVQKQQMKTRIQPSKRLLKMIPEDYWKGLEDTETKDIVDNIGQSPSVDDQDKENG